MIPNYYTPEDGLNIWKIPACEGNIRKYYGKSDRIDAIVNTANPGVTVGAGCDLAVYKAAGYDQLLAYRKEHIGEKEEGEVFLTPGFGLPARYIENSYYDIYGLDIQLEEHGEKCIIA